jgi:hypothetical protein
MILLHTETLKTPVFYCVLEYFNNGIYALNYYDYNNLPMKRNFLDERSQKEVTKWAAKRAVTLHKKFNPKMASA